MHQLIIARYAESLDWLELVPQDFAVHVYNKGEMLPAELPAGTKLVPRRNAGRESETYLTHALRLKADPESGVLADDFVVFAQGDPFEHSPDFIELLHNWRAWDDVQPLAWRWKIARDIPPAATILARETGDFLNGLRVRPELFSLATWAPLGFADAGTHWLQETYRAVHELPEGSNIAAHFFRLCGLAEHGRQAEGHLLGRFSYGALFAVRRSRIAAVPADALSRMRDAALGHEVYGYVMERLWLHLFGQKFLLPAPTPEEELASLQELSGASLIPPDGRSQHRQKLDKLLRRVQRAVAG